jgi:membrane protein implicated in regulation of membrane protease activity
MSIQAFYRLKRATNRMLIQRHLSLIGVHGIVSTSFVDGKGKVRLGDSVWLAEGADLLEGTPIVVRSARGTSVIVAAAEHDRRPGGLHGA